MDIIKKLVGIALTAISLSSFSGIDGLTHHSRANCAGFNETVTWWLGHSVSARVESHHYPECLLGRDRNKHIVQTVKSSSWRHAAYHPTESYSGTYCVVGNHFMYIKGVEHLIQSESVTDCNIYDGWWDYK